MGVTRIISVDDRCTHSNTQTMEEKRQIKALLATVRIIYYMRLFYKVSFCAEHNGKEGWYHIDNTLLDFISFIKFPLWIHSVWLPIQNMWFIFSENPGNQRQTKIMSHLREFVLHSFKATHNWIKKMIIKKQNKRRSIIATTPITSATSQTSPTQHHYQYPYHHI